MSVSEVMSGLGPIGLAMIMLGTGCESVTVIPMPGVDAGREVVVDDDDGGIVDPTVDAGPRPDHGQTPPDAGPPPMPDAGPDPDDIRSPSGLALRECQRLARCTPLVYAARYGVPGNEGADLSSCVEARQAAYMEGPLSWEAQGDVGAIADPEACEAALDDCTNFRAFQTPIGRARGHDDGDDTRVEECRRVGLVPLGGDCGRREQCSDGLYCATADGDLPAGLCGGGTCQEVRFSRNCLREDFGVDPCDNAGGEYCVHEFDDGEDNHLPRLEDRLEQCQRLGAPAFQGADCNPQSTRQCDLGLFCDRNARYSCQPFRDPNAECESDAECDAVLGYTCRDVPGRTGQRACQTAALAEIGEVCGFVTQRVDGRPVQVEVGCPSDIAYCDESVLPFRCAHRRRAGEACDDDSPCRAPYVCTSGEDGRRCRLPGPTCG